MSVDDGWQSELPTPHAEIRFNVGAASALVAASYARSGNGDRHWFSNPRRRLKQLRNRAIGEAPNDAMGVLLSLIADCDLHAYNTRAISKWWGRAYYLLGLPAAVLATIAGAAALVSTAGRIPVAIVALISAGLTTSATFLNSNENKQSNIRFSAAWQKLADDARLAVIRYGTLPDRPEQVARDDYLIQRVIQLNQRKSALLRGDLAQVPEQSAHEPMLARCLLMRWPCAQRQPHQPSATLPRPTR